MIYALDTNIISYLLRYEQNPEVARRFQNEIERGNAYVIPPMSYYETTWYLLRKRAAAQLRIFQELYQGSLSPVYMNETEIDKAAQIRARLTEQGNVVGDADIFIAAHCIMNDYTLVTNNVKDFERIDGLKYVNWAS